jgi:rfaE bifunctional protein kinase chain/domain
MVLEKYDCDPLTLAGAVQQFPKKKILVLGDVMLDRFVWGSVSRISPEAPVPVVEIRTETTCLGGAANVASNIRSLGGSPILIGVVGRDADGEILTAKLRSLDAPTGGLIAARDRATSVKTRIIAHHQQVCRTDREDKSPISAGIQAKVAATFLKYLPVADAVVISDYAKGLISCTLLRQILPRAQSAGKIVCVDPKLKNLKAYQPATVITPNTLETERASGMTIANTKDLLRAGRRILRQTGIAHLLITRGEEGMTLFEEHGRISHIPTQAREVFDVTGAGDTVISTLALGLVTGLSILQAAVLSNVAAGIAVGKLGTASVTPDELLARIRG